MSTLLEDTDAGRIAGALVDARSAAGSPAMGMVMTLVVVVPQDSADAALASAAEASREHPSRRLGVIIGAARGRSRIDAEIRAGSGVAGEDALIRLSGEVTRHPASVVLPLLLPDSPVVVWWPTHAPDDPAHDPLGALGTRRITDAAQVPVRRARAMLTQCESYEPGNTDLAWTRITPWRALLASALDQVEAPVTAARLAAERISPSADLLGAWLADRLEVEVTRKRSEGPGINEVVLSTRQGDVRVKRLDERSAILCIPTRPEQPVALRRRTIPELLAEELRRLDPDDIYAATVRKLSAIQSNGGDTTRKRTTNKKKTKKASS